MKTVTCFIPGTLRDETADALIRYAKNVELRLIDPNVPTQYGKVIAEYWKKGESFLVVEPDIVINPLVFIAINECDCEYGCFPYAWKTNVGPALGCTWFKDTFIAKYPNAAFEASHVSWRQFDVVFMRHVLARKYGEQPHVHLPPVVHLNEEKQLLPDADPTPLMEVPLW